MSIETKPIAESSNFIVLNEYKKIKKTQENYQSESDLENELIEDLTKQGYEFRKDITNPEAMLENVRFQIQKLNNINFTDSEWERFISEFLNKPNESQIDKTKRIHDNYIHDFTFDDGHTDNIYLLDKTNLPKNTLQVIRQFKQGSKHKNRYDVTLLVNGLPLVHLELKKRGIAIREAFNQTARYKKESFNSKNSLYKYVQMFIITNGTDTRYFANTIERDKNSFDFTMNWASFNNKIIKDLKDFTATFLQKNTLLNVLLRYCVFDSSNTLLIMRPYQIAATERILWRIENIENENKYGKSNESGGYIWHTTGSGKTLTSFKAAQMATQLDYIDKVFFVVDRKDLDYQTMNEYRRFSEGSVIGSDNTKDLREKIHKHDDRIIVTTIQKLNHLMKKEKKLDIYNKKVVFILDECHRSQFGEAQRNLKERFKKYCQFGFTGTPIFSENSSNTKTTQEVFGEELHSYVITDAIRDEKVLKFKIDYNDTRPVYKDAENEQDEIELNKQEIKQALRHPERIKEISKYILDNFDHKTHRKKYGENGFNAMFAVDSVESAKLYYETFKEIQKESKKPERLKIATIFSFQANEEQNPIGDIPDEVFNVSAMDSTAKEFLDSVVRDYNNFFGTNYTVDGDGFQNYYRDLAERVKEKKVDLLIVVGMFLTGFDAPTLNTLFVDKNLKFHGLIQAFSRTNRILNSTKTCGNIVTFRNLEDATIEAIKLFGEENSRKIIIERPFKDYFESSKDEETGEIKKGFIDVVQDLLERFPDSEEIVKDKDKEDFVKVFGEYLCLENKLRNYDEFTKILELQAIDKEDKEEIQKFQENYNLTDIEIQEMQNISILSPRQEQDYRSTYNDIREWVRQQRESENQENLNVNLNDFIFEVELLKSQEINLDYILELIYDKNKEGKDKETLIEEIKSVIGASSEHRAKEEMIVEFIHQTELENLNHPSDIIEKFYIFEKEKLENETDELIKSEKLDPEKTRKYIENSIRRGFANENGDELNQILPEMSPLNPKYREKKQVVLKKIKEIVKKFKTSNE